MREFLQNFRQLHDTVYEKHCQVSEILDMADKRGWTKGK